MQKLESLASKEEMQPPKEFQWENKCVDENYKPVHEGDGADITWLMLTRLLVQLNSLRGPYLCQTNIC
jgi:hypothetical protein